MTILTMTNVGVALPRAAGIIPILEDFSLTLEAGELRALLGESGSGKSLAALSIPRLLPRGARLSGQITLCGEELTVLSEREMRARRGARVGMVFQDPLAALNPSHRIGAQIAESIRLHEGATRQAAWARAVDLLDEVGIPEPAARAHHYPHQFSGGMRQRAMIAVALACNPALVIADEPTTGLDALLKLQILELLARLRRDRQMAVLLVTHDLALAKRHADSVQVLYAGRTMEHGPASAFFAAPRHPYSLALLHAAPVPGQAPAPIKGQLPEPEARPPGCRFAPRCARAQPVCEASPPAPQPGATTVTCFFPLETLEEAEAARQEARRKQQAQRHAARATAVLELRHVTVRYRTGLLGAPTAPVVQEANLTLTEGECLAIIGGSGSGKTSLGRAILQMVPHEGEVALRGTVLNQLRGPVHRAARRRIGVVMQDPIGSLNPAMTVEAAISDALLLGGERSAAARTQRAADLLASVGLPAELFGRLPTSLSGGQAQRVAIARALAANPEVLVLDEPTSSLDVSSQAVVLTLLRDLTAERGIACVLITHDLAAVSFMAHRYAVVFQGRIVEVAAADEFLAGPKHPHAVSLVEGLLF
jgi:oligopeptide/dipeptide ABC transporter ATP-binding protein